eukprot:gene12167-15489_t
MYANYAWYEATCFDGHLYSINTVSGVVLFDGLTMNRLSESVRNHPMFKWTFGDCNFEVQISGVGVFDTVREMFDCRYSFHTNDAELLVVETFRGASEEDRCELTLLSRDGGPDGRDPRFAFPRLLRTAYSHWLTEDKRWILFRSESYTSRLVYFIFNVYDETCYRIPSRHAARSWTFLVTQLVHYDQLMVLPGDQTVVDTLVTKFED